MDTTTITIERTFDVPIERVWQAWTDPEQIKKWWGPKDFTAPFITNELRVGGSYLYCMRGSVKPGAPTQDFWSGGTYKEIIPLKKIVATDHFTDEDGHKISPNDVGMPGEWPDEMVVTVTFEAINGSTELAIVHEGHPKGMVEMAKLGWEQSLDKLEASFA